MDNPQERLVSSVSDYELGWLIGIIDGEGCFWMGEGRKEGYSWYMPCFEMSNTNPEIMEKFANILYKLGISYHIYTPTRNSNQREYKKLEVKGQKRLSRFFRVLRPFFECRHEQAKLLDEFVSLRMSVPTNLPYSHKEHVIYQLLRKENKRGN